MAKKGKGAMVNVSTMVADYGAPGMSLYDSSKAAINLLTKVWAAEYGPSGVRVNAVSPGPTRTEGTNAMSEGLEQLAAQAPAGRPARQMKSLRRSSFCLQTGPVLFTAQNSLSTEGALLFKTSVSRCVARLPHSDRAELG
jgi:NAD(P)-dependent dehydrogenase (short-subunit alcohol dehydrogenase family)